MAKRTDGLLGAAHWGTSMDPTHVQRFRENTDKLVHYSFKSQKCPVCRKMRSIRQFKEGRQACLSCPEPKE